MNKITCPKCNHEFSLNEAESHVIEEKIRKQVEEEQSKKLDEDKRKMWLLAQEKAREKVEGESKVLRDQLEEKDKKLQEARDMELKLRQAKQQVEEDKKNLDLELQRKLDEEREKIRQKTERELLERYHLKEKEKDQIIDSLKSSLDEAQRKANQGSQQLQGEILELELEEFLKKEFPLDEILPVPKGINGADVIQKVKDQFGKDCGLIIWEAKRTKNWTEGWIQKLKDDQRLSKADMAILVSTVLPDGVKNFEHRDGVYIASFDAFLSVAKLLRMSLSQLNLARQSSVNKSEKMEILYQYLSSSDFRNKVEAIVEAFTSMKANLNREKVVYTRLWATREKQIQKVVDNTVGMYGDLQGLMGKSLAQIDSLEIESLSLLEDGIDESVLDSE